jgi:sirohydrochlorin cobaltochelatase
MNGLLLFAHGARDAAWARPFEAVAARLRAARPDTPLALAYLEFMSPGMLEAANQLAAAGCTTVQVVPLFLGAGGHVRRDIPPLLAALREQHGERIDWQLHPAIGEQPGVLDAIAAACEAALP